MRTIKFRAWVNNKQNRYMAIQGEPDLETLESFMFHYGTENNLMQFTGLQDKNGKDIYEGDIIKRIVKTSKLLPSKKYIEQIVYEEASFCSKSICDIHNIPDVLGHYTFHKIEVIGNIYENPELLSTPTAVL